MPHHLINGRARRFALKRALPEHEPVLLGIHWPWQHLAPLPPAVTHEAILPPARDQGDHGICFGCSRSAEIEAFATRKGIPLALSEMFLQWITRVNIEGDAPDADIGATNSDASKALGRFGCARAELWPAGDDHFALPPPDEAFADARTRLVTASVSIAIDDLKRALVEGPVVVGFMVPASVASDASISESGDIPLPKPGEDSLGGHSVLVYSYDDATDKFGILNSWGLSFGKDGKGTLPQDMARRGLMFDATATRALEGVG